MGFNRDDHAASLMTLGRRGKVIDLSGGDQTLGDSVKAVVVTQGGTVSYRPCREKEGSIDFDDLSAGTVLLHIPGVVFAAGTTATLATIED